MIEVLFPNKSEGYDRDGDGLLDLEIRLSDSLSGIDLGRLEVRSSRPVKGPAGSGSNLLQHWRVVRADSTGLVLEETADNLLPRGGVTLMIRAADRSGNLQEKSVPIDLPLAARHKIIDLQASLIENTSQIELSLGLDKAYVTTEEVAGSAVSVIDLSTLEVTKIIRSPIRALSRMVLDGRRNKMYLVSLEEPRIVVLDLVSESFEAAIEISSGGLGAAIDRQRDRLYVGLQMTSMSSSAFISEIDLATQTQTRVFDLGVPNRVNPGFPLGLLTLLFDESEQRLLAITAPTFGLEGLLVVDPDSGALLGQADLLPGDGGRLDGGSDIDRLGSNLVATSFDANGFGRIVLLNPATTDVIRSPFLAQFLGPKKIAVAPNAVGMAVSAADVGVGYHAILLIDATTLRVEWEERFSEDAVFPEDVAFRPDGNVFFLAGSEASRFQRPTPSQLIAYLHR